MLDFTSALYLGLRHPSNSLRPWASLSTGVPAALQAPPGETKVAKSIAALLGQEQALLAPSTLHLVWDLFGVLSAGRFAILIDDGTYPISRWGAERAAARGVPIRDFAHHDISQVSAAVTWAISMRRRPFLVTDGFCPGCGRAAPLPTYLELLGPARGELFIDDTQALGILGSKPSYSNTYGVGGRGTLAWHGVEHREAIVVCSLAKGFGAPIACLAGPERWV